MFTEESFNKLIEIHKDTVFRIALNYTKCIDVAEDITQNVFIKLYCCNRAFESQDHIKHWLIRVTVNECKKVLLSPWQKRETIDDYAETISFATEEHSDLFYAVMSLPKKYRIVIYLHYYEGYRTEEISEILGIPAATVRTQLKRGRDLLKKSLEE